MVLFNTHSVESTGHPQFGFIPTDAKSETVKSAGCALGALGITMLIAGPAQASPEITFTQPTYAAPSSFTQSSQLESSRLERLQQLQAGVSAERRIQAQRLAASSASITAEGPSLSSAEHNFEAPYSAQPTTDSTAPDATATVTTGRWADGVYLYGQQPVANQLATAYFVFEAQDNNVTGAFYMPSSSFDCVQGQVAATEMQLSVTDSYSQETSNYELALTPASTQIASISGTGTTLPNISGFHSLPVSDHDRTLLSTCQAHL